MGLKKEKFMHKGRYGLKEIITKKEMEYDFVWVRKHFAIKK